MADNPHVRDNPPVLSDEIVVFNDAPTPGDDLARHPQMQAVGLAVSTGNGVAGWVSDELPIPVRDAGTYQYASGVSPATISLPGVAQLRRVSVRAGDVTDATISIGGGDTIIVPVGESFDEQIPGEARGVVVVVGGSIRAYYISWVG